MAAALNVCGYDEGLDDSAPVRKQVRDEINQALAKSEDARAKRDTVCLFIAQHRMTGTELDIAQYISLALYLTPAAGARDHGRPDGDAARRDPGGGDCAPPERLCGRGRPARHLAHRAPHLRRGRPTSCTIPLSKMIVCDQSLSEDAGSNLRRPPLRRGD